ncbi:hypothetical protein [Vibrio panuliri]|uniref:Uncharacterized protein n=1 Tax=Vibrio panuliri TaxID=1381081 RepID=A0A1Q9H9X8_9VIBR|nr:hypothetical protein [Vibrio panuliri]KAB1457447.1 hypothetical protein F7O85_06820 [Vibrio panuliri]OLQ85893.1 hypothetical protein BIY22_13490 [Vibrio panuliri]OLQ91392.1 hypothetical protein BIY20_00865 [Vibrio panuliri]
MNYHYAPNYTHYPSMRPQGVARLDMLKSQLSELSQKQLSELRSAIDAKLDSRPAATLSDEESAFISRLFQS